MTRSRASTWPSLQAWSSALTSAPASLTPPTPRYPAAYSAALAHREQVSPDFSRQSTGRSHMRNWVAALLAVGAMAFPRTVDAQGLTGALVGTVKDEQGAVLPGALVRI